MTCRGSVPANAIELRGLTRSYGDVHALRGLDLDVPVGSIFGFLGPNGAGKTTTIRILVGLLRATSGRVRVLGLDPGHDSLEIRRNVGYLAQLPRFHDDLTPRETLRFARRFFPGGHSRTAEAQIDDVIDLVGIGDVADRAVGGLSGGQRQRLGIAQACVHQPRLLVLDEPAAALDPIGRRDVLTIMQKLRGDTTIFFSTHILDDVQRVADTVAVVDHGVRIAQATTDDLLGDGTPSYLIEVQGSTERARSALRNMPWVTDIGVDGGQATSMLTVQVAAAGIENELLRALLDSGSVSVVSFRPHRFDLEDVFMRLVEPTPR